MGKVMVVAGEVSGDMHAARIVREIRRLAPDTEIFGMGSDQLKKEGVEIMIDPTAVSSVGITESLKNIKTHYSHLQLLKKSIEEKNPDVLFLVDNSGFNMMMTRLGYKKKIPVVDYFPPTAWAWGKWRARWMARYGATIAAVFPMESEVYTWAGAETCYVGHPLLDMVRVEEEVSEIYQYLEFDPGKPVIGLLPGSRRAEIDRLLPEMLQAAEKLQGEDHHLQFVIPVAPGFSGPEISRMASNYRVIIKAVNDYTYQVMKVSDLLVTASGTATLEAAIFKTPMIIVYKTSNLTYRLVKRLVKVDFISLPNIIAGREIVPELIQDEAKSENIYRRCKDLIYKPYLTVNTRKNLETVKDKLGKEGAVNRTARLVLKKGAIDYLDGK